MRRWVNMIERNCSRIAAVDTRRQTLSIKTGAPLLLFSIMTHRELPNITDRMKVETEQILLNLLTITRKKLY